MTTYLTLAEVATELRASLHTVRYWIALGKLPSTKPGRVRLVRRDDLDRFVRRAERRLPESSPSAA